MDTAVATAPSPDVSPPNVTRSRLRLAALIVLAVFWLLPWPEMELLGDAPGATPTYERLAGAERTGAPGALSLLAVWGLAATALAASTVRGMRIGSALTDFTVAAGASLLLVLEHPWLPGGEIREAWGAIFGPLALLALLDALVLAFGRRGGYEVTVIRAGAAFFAGGCLAASLAWIPAGIAFWLALAPLLWLKIDRPRAGRRALELLILVGAVAHGFSTQLHAVFVGVGRPAAERFNLPFVVWGMATALVVITAVDGVLRPEAEDDGGALE